MFIFKYEQLPNSNNVSYHIYEIIKMLEFIMSNSYAMYGKSIFKQINGIPQGNSASPLLADLTLMAMEVKYILANQQDYSKTNFIAARYIGDILFIGQDLKKILENTKNMYHSSLTLTQTNPTTISCDFLDLTILIRDRKLTTKMYNKTDAFDFKVLKYPQFSSNIHSSIICSTIAGEIVRIERSCSEFDTFDIRMKDLFKNLIENGYSTVFIKKQFFKNIMRRKSIRYKYKMDNLDNIHQFLVKI